MFCSIQPKVFVLLLQSIELWLRIFGIIAAEYIFRMVPAGTHTWNKFVRPTDLVKHSKKVRLSFLFIFFSLFYSLDGFSVCVNTGMFLIPSQIVGHGQKLKLLVMPYVQAKIS